MSLLFHRDFSWRWFVALHLYRLASPLLLMLALPSWLRKMTQRGGWGTPMRERFGQYHDDAEWTRCGRTHIHAVSVGETLIALKLIHQWQAVEDESVVLAVSTATAYQLARTHASDRLTVVYAPLDLTLFVKSYLNRFEPKQIVLIEAEVWPILMSQCQIRKIPVTMLNARLSSRSEKRLKMFWPWIAPMYHAVTRIGVQGTEDQDRLISLGIHSSRLTITGSIKFDPSAATPPRQRLEFSEILTPLANNQRVVLAASTHDGEEALLAQALASANYFLVVVPRHAERRHDVLNALRAVGRHPWLRSEGKAPPSEHWDCLIVDSTGELRDWTAHADAVVIGKSFLSLGGQNPAEAILASIPVIAGPHMENFEPLTTQLRERGAIYQVESAEQIPDALERLFSEDEHRHQICDAALQVLTQHQRATQRSIELITHRPIS